MKSVLNTKNVTTNNIVENEVVETSTNLKTIKVFGKDKEVNISDCVKLDLEITKFNVKEKISNVQLLNVNNTRFVYNVDGKKILRTNIEKDDESVKISSYFNNQDELNTFKKEFIENYVSEKEYQLTMLKNTLSKLQ